jgi:hypothetical protein
MTETLVLLLAIAAATVAALVAVALSLARVGPPANEKARSLPARVLCPATGAVARVEIGFDRDDTRLAVTRCEYAPDGVFSCERECFPTLILAPLSFAPASAS